MSDWMSPLNKLAFAKAIKARAKTCTIDDGRVFDINYNYKGYIGKAWIKGKEVTPCGWVDLERVDKDEWWYGDEKMVVRNG